MTTTDLGPILVTSDLGALEGLFRKAPVITAFHSRVMLGRWFARHYKTWKVRLPARLKQMERRGAIRFYVDPGPKARTDADIRKAVEADPRLDRIGGRAEARSETTSLLERGGTVRPKQGSYLAIPTGKFRRMSGEKLRSQIGASPEDYSRRHPDRPLFPLGRRRGGGNAIFLGRTTGQKTATGREKVEVVYILQRQATIAAQLGVLAAWDELQGYRDETLGVAIERIVAEMEKELDRQVAAQRRSG